MKNKELDSIKSNKLQLYKSLKEVISVGRKYGVELFEINDILYKCNEKKINALKYLNKYLSNSLLTNIGHIKESLVSEKITYGGLIELICDKYKFNDDISEIKFKVTKSGDDKIYVLIYIDKINSNNCSYDIFVVNTNGLRR